MEFSLSPYYFLSLALSKDFRWEVCRVFSMQSCYEEDGVYLRCIVEPEECVTFTTF